jgi:hypothetical protein
MTKHWRRARAKPPLPADQVDFDVSAAHHRLGEALVVLAQGNFALAAEKPASAERRLPARPGLA